MKAKITLEHLKTLDPCSEGLDWYVDNIKTENILEVLLQLNSHKPNWSRWLMIRLLTKKQKQLLAIFSAESVLHIYEEKYPKDTRVRECIQASKDYLDDKIDKHTLIYKRRAVAYAAATAAYDDAYDDAYAAANAAVAAAAYDANAAVAAAAYDANAAVAAAAYDANAAYAAYAADAYADAAVYTSNAAYAAYDDAAAAYTSNAAYAAAYAAADAADAAYAARKEIQEKIINEAWRLLNEN